jgi:hypothetical protein
MLKAKYFRLKSIKVSDEDITIVTAEVLSDKRIKYHQELGNCLASLT